MKRLFLLAPVILCGCAGFGRPAADVLMGVGGAYLGHQLSDGNPLITAASAGGAVALSEGAQALMNRAERRAFDDGYTKGRSDGVKQLYWSLQQNQRLPSITEIKSNR